MTFRATRLSLCCLVAGFLLFAAGTADAQIARFVAGDDYRVIPDPVEQPADGKVHVAEFFLYSCPHCYHFEPTLEGWQKTLGRDVVFSHVPVLFGPDGEIYARLFYTEKALGVLDRLHDQIFDAIHRDGNPLNTRGAIRAFLTDHGVSGQQFDHTFDSDAVNENIARAAELMRRMQVVAVPSMTVEGRYWISGRTAGSNDDMLDVVNFLVNEREDNADGGA